MDKESFLEIKEKALSLIREEGACEQSRIDFTHASHIGQFCDVLGRYWGYALGKFRKGVLRIFEELYPCNRMDFNEQGIWYNEPTDKGKAIVTCGDFLFCGTARVWAFGNSRVVLNGQSRCVAKGNVRVSAYDTSYVQLMGRSMADMKGRSRVNAGGRSVVRAYDSCVVDAGDRSTVFAYGWNRISATGNACVNAPKSARIVISGSAELVIGKSVGIE